MHKKYITSCIQFNTPLGWLTVFATKKGICKIKFGKFCNVGAGLPSPYKEIKRDILDYLSGKQVKFNYPLDISLTPFQEKALKKVRQISYGKTISYKELAKKLNSSPRACGQALAKNPIPIIIPCHRIIQVDGDLGGFSGGIEWKRKLLQLERFQQKNHLKYKKSLQFKF